MMAEITPCASQENNTAPVIETSSPVHDGESPSSPILPIIPLQSSTKPRKAPTITPRTFTRFFTPKSSLRRGARIGASRKVLRDITATGSNRKGHGKRVKDLGQVESWSESGGTPQANKRKKYTPPSPATSVDFSSPLKRIHYEALNIPEDNGVEEENIKFESDDDDSSEHDFPKLAQDADMKPITRSEYRTSLGQGLRQNIGDRTRAMWSLSANSRTIETYEYQHETANFYTNPEDAHNCHNILTPSNHTIPFCTASCNTNSLIAVGDEDGGIRLLESAKEQNPGFSKPWLTFRPHSNAILNLDFSPDDLRLATASGDQTSKIIDMPTQRAIYTMAGHFSSVKQVRFQPGSSDVLATSSRDGSLQIWDLRCKGLDTPVRDLLVPVNANASTAQGVTIPKMTWARSVNTILEAHANRQVLNIPSQASDSSSTIPMTTDAPSKSEAPKRRGDVSVTALAFLPGSRSHLLLTGSEANASVKLWDLRTMHTSRRSSRTATALSSTQQPESHNRHRHFGLTSLCLSGDGARLYTLCRDNTVYAYSTSHLILGHAPELSTSLSSSTKPKRSVNTSREKEGLGPLYGFRHPSFHATTFYVGSALRPTGLDNTELLAVGSSDGCAVVFPTAERYMDGRYPRSKPPSRILGDLPSSSQRRGLTRTDSGLAGRLNDTIPIYQHGTALVRGHNREVTGLTWTKGGELVTVGDDFAVRCWREEDREFARSLRMEGEAGGKRWGCGWADVKEGFDDDDDE